MATRRFNIIYGKTLLAEGVEFANGQLVTRDVFTKSAPLRIYSSIDHVARDYAADTIARIDWIDPELPDGGAVIDDGSHS